MIHHFCGSKVQNQARWSPIVPGDVGHGTMASRSNQMNGALAITATALSLGAVATAAFLTYEYLSSETILSRWTIQHFRPTTPERSAQYRAARYRHRLLLARIIRRTAPRHQILAVDPEMLKGLVQEIFPTKKSNKSQRPLDRSTNAGGAMNRTADGPSALAAADLLRMDRIEQNQDGDYVLRFLIRSNSTSSSNTSFWRGRRKQVGVPLLPFCRAVLDSPHVDTHTLCFLYDATGGQDDIVLNLLQADPSVVTIRPGRPALWMQQCATDLHLSKDHQDLVLQSLVRVEAALVLLQAKAATTTTTTAAVKPKSIVVPISSEFVPLLMAPLSAVFSNDKHIFLYTGCIQAVAAMQQQPQHRAIWPLQPLVSIHVRKTTEFHAALAKLPNPLSAAVDALILRQDDGQQDRFFRPYVCRLDHLFMSAGQMDHDGAGTEPNNNNWAVRSLLRYCCGATATIDPYIVEAATKTLQSTTPTALLRSVVSRYGPDIDAAVFCHERIVLSHRILPNTVPPIEHWTLAPRSTGVAPDCACCIGSTEDGAADDKEQLATEQEEARSSGARSEIADGRMGFAFDPSRFG
jgi:hypothetical protein